ncbi:MAG: MarR family transcriptional regulator [Pseudomonadota bacterium]
MSKTRAQPVTDQPADHQNPGPLIAGVFERNDVRDTFRVSYLANRLVLPVYDEIKREFGLSRGEYLLLFCLSYVDDLTAQDVADVTGRPRNSISRAVHRMLNENYLTRSPHPTDGRQVLLRITPKGERLHRKIIPLFQQREQEILSALNSEERKQLDHLLGKLASAVPD